jgi:hypothetical protein
MVLRELIIFTPKFLLKAVPRIITFIISCASTFRILTSHQGSLNVVCDIPLLTNSTPLTADMIALRTTKEPVPKR